MEARRGQWGRNAPPLNRPSLALSLGLVVWAMSPTPANSAPQAWPSLRPAPPASVGPSPSPSPTAGRYSAWPEVAPGKAETAASQPQPVALPRAAVPWPLGLSATSRTVLLAYLGSEQPIIRGENPLTATEAALNHLGMVCEYLDLEKGLPSAARFAEARGLVAIVSQDNMPRAADFARLVLQGVAAGKGMVFIGGLPFQREAPSGEAIPTALSDAALEALGLRQGPAGEGRPWQLAWSPGTLPWPTFELGPWAMPTTRLPLKALPTSKVLARVTRVDTGVAADAVVLSAGGAVSVGLEHLLSEHPFSYKLQWRLDPHPFFREALHLGGLPAFDPTTVNGRRVFYAHIDGDGAGNVADLPGRPLAAEVVRDELLAKTWLPTTVSFIAKEVVASSRLQEAARRIFARPNVEPASHSYTHPFNWESAFVAGHGQTKDTGEDEEGLELERERQSHSGANLERLTPVHEIDESVAALNRYAPPEKPVALMLWSGRTNPTPLFLARCAALKLPNLNGGDSMVDPSRPSIAPLAPFGRRVNGFLQPYASCANENIFTNLWTGPFDGQMKALLTFEKGGHPRRRAAANAYYHFYAGERRGGLRALRALYQWAEKAPIAPIWASDYARMVEGFFGGELAALPGGAGWVLKGHAACKALRFEGESREPDLARSEGVAGYWREGDRLWVHLASDPATLRWRAPGGPAQPRLAWASAPLVGFEQAPGRLKLNLEAAAKAEVLLAGLPPGMPLEVEGGWVGPAKVAPDGSARIRGAAGKRQLRVYWRQP